VFQSYIDTGETERLAEYVSEYRVSLPADTEIEFCGNYAVNSIVRYYADIAKNEGVKVDVRLNIAENTGVNDSDLCIVFGNCIENAIEACRKIKDGEKFIKINAGLTGKMFTVTVDNSFDGTVKEANGVFMSRKHEGEGIGISSVKAIARKYNGESRFGVSGEVFKASVMLKVKRD
jgi:sensor histidine kinase regulating citrate/malate metabolism